MRDRDTGRSRGFGFVTFGTNDEANAAIAALNEEELDGRRIKVNLANSRGSGGGGGGGGLFPCYVSFTFSYPLPTLQDTAEVVVEEEDITAEEEEVATTRVVIAVAVVVATAAVMAVSLVIKSIRSHPYHVL